MGLTAAKVTNRTGGHSYPAGRVPPGRAGSPVRLVAHARSYVPGP